MEAVQVCILEILCFTSFHSFTYCMMTSFFLLPPKKWGSCTHYGQLHTVPHMRKSIQASILETMILWERDHKHTHPLHANTQTPYVTIIIKIKNAQINYRWFTPQSMKLKILAVSQNKHFLKICCWHQTY